MYSRPVRPFLWLSVLAALAAGCRGGSLPSGSSEPILIGAVLPLSGDGLEGDGPFYRDGMLLAIREANAAGGPIPGRHVELVVLDGRDEPAVAAMQARALIEQGAVAILGDAASASTREIYETVTREARIPQISCTSTSILLTTRNEELTPDERFFFRTAPSDRDQARVVLDVATTEAACSGRIALLYQEDDYGTPLAQDIQQLVTTELGAGALVASESFAPTASNFDAELAAINTANPNCVVLVTYPPAAGDIMRAYRVLSPTSTARFIGTDALYTPTLLTEAGSAAVIDGFYGTAPLTQDTTPQYNAFAARLEAVFGDPPIPFQSNCYDAASLLMLAIAQAGSTDGAAIRDALRELSGPTSASIDAAALDQGFDRIFGGTAINYEGASGHVDFDELGDVEANYVIWRFDASTMGFTTERIYRPGMM